MKNRRIEFKVKGSPPEYKDEIITGVVCDKYEVKPNPFSDSNVIYLVKNDEGVAYRVRPERIVKIFDKIKKHDR